MTLHLFHILDLDNLFESYKIDTLYNASIATLSIKFNNKVMTKSSY